MSEFYCPPESLEASVRGALEVHRRIQNPKVSEARPWLADFLLRLEVAQPSDYPDLATTLRRGELRLLASLLGELHGKPIFAKLGAFLTCRPEAEVYRVFWGLLGRHCEDAGVVSLVDQLRPEPAWTALTPPELPPLPAPLSDGARIAGYLASSYGSGPDAWLAAVEGWRVLSPLTEAQRWEDLPLGRLCLRALLTRRGTPLFGRESEADIRRWVRTILPTSEGVRAFGQAYLETLPESDWGDGIFSDVIARLGDPRLKPELWNGFSAATIRAVIRRINLRKLSEFFLQAAGDAERFEFWKQFVDHMGPNSEGRIAAGQGFFEFPGFGVIEFMQVGNAAYIYPSEVYQRFRGMGQVSNALLKDRDLCIDRIVHRRGGYGSWVDQWTPVIRQMVLRGRRAG